MNILPRDEHDLVRYLMAVVDGVATPEEEAFLNRQIEQRPELASLVVEVMNQESWLRWDRAKAGGGGPLRPDVLESILVAAAETSPAAVSPRPISPPPAGPVGTTRSGRLQAGRILWSALAASVVVAIGWTSGFRYANRQFDEQRLAATPLNTPADGPSDEQPRYVARFVRQTACSWNTDDPGDFDGDRALRMGESLRLLEGIAEVQFDWVGGRASLQIEGPAGLVLTADRGASLSHGRLTADIRAGESHFHLDTPNARIEVSEDAAIGVAVEGSGVQLHVFRGEALAVIPWADDRRGPRRAVVAAGRSLCIMESDQGNVQLQHGESSTALFASEQSMTSDALLITAEYARKVLEAGPLVYWRFEEPGGDRVVNEAGDRCHGRIVGVAGRVQQRENHVLDLGSSIDAAALTTYLISDEPIAEQFPAGYAVELWIKPSHYHWCSLASFICPPLQPGWRNPHAILLELGGPRAADSQIERAGRVRFLHRSPPSDNIASGTSLYSQSAYDVRKWQHVVAVKDGDRLVLYIDGRVAAEATDPTPLDPNWKIVLGQLDQQQTYRRFIGQIDEFAFYPQSLSAAEVRQHYELVRRPANKGTTPPAGEQTVALLHSDLWATTSRRLDWTQ